MAAMVGDELEELAGKSVKAAMKPGSRHITAHAHPTKPQIVAGYDASFRGSLLYDSAEDEPRVAHEIWLGDAEGNRNSDTGKKGVAIWVTLAKVLGSDGAAAASGEGELELLDGETKFDYVMPRIQENITAVKAGDTRRAQLYGKKHAEADSRNMASAEHDGSKAGFELPVKGSYIPEYEPRSSPLQARYDAHDYAPSESEDEDEVSGMLIASSRKGKGKRKQAARKKGSGSCSAKKQKQMGHGKKSKRKSRK